MKISNLIRGLIVACLLTSCVSPVLIEPTNSISLKKDEGVVVFRLIFAGRASNIRFENLNNDDYFQINYAGKELIPKSYVVKSGRYCLKSFNFSGPYVNTKMSSLGTGYCISVEPGKVTIAPELYEKSFGIAWKDNSKQIAMDAYLTNPSIRPFLNVKDGLLANYKEPPKLNKPALPLLYELPSYPKKAAILGIGGWVHFSFGLDSNGKPIGIKVLDSSPEDIFVDVATKAIKQWTFENKLSDEIGPRLQYVVKFKIQN